jgi:hypothetical protein
MLSALCSSPIDKHARVTDEAVVETACSAASPTNNVTEKISKGGISMVSVTLIKIRNNCMSKKPTMN